MTRESLQNVEPLVKTNLRSSGMFVCIQFLLTSCCLSTFLVQLVNMYVYNASSWYAFVITRISRHILLLLSHSSTDCVLLIPVGVALVSLG